MVSFKYGRKTDNWQDFYIPLDCGQLNYTAKVSEGTEKIEKLVKYMNENNITNWFKTDENFKRKCVFNNVEYKQIG